MLTYAHTPRANINMKLKQSCRRNTVPLRGCSLLVLLASLLFRRSRVALALGSNDVVRVRLGYFDSPNPFMVACARGWLDLARNEQKDLPAYEVECYIQSDGGTAASRLDNAELDISSLGSSPWAVAIARGLDLKEILIRGFIENDEGIYVREDDPTKGYIGIKSPRDLINRTIATPFSSTAHYQLSFLIKEYEITGQVDVVDLSPAEISKAWKDGTIDGAACWGGAREYVLENKGRELIFAGVFSHWGAPTYTVSAVRRAFAIENPQFMEHLVGVLSRLTDSFQDQYGRQDPKNPARWDVANDKNYLGSIVDAQMRGGEVPGDPSKAQLILAREKLDTEAYHSTAEQLTCNYMGAAIGSCGELAGQHLDAINTAKFLFEQKLLSTMGIMDANDESCKDNTSFCGGDTIDPSYLNQSRTGSAVGTPLGPYENFFVDDDDSENDAVLSQLERLDAENNRSQYATNEFGRNFTFGHSNCTDNFNITDPLNGTFGDGASALPGRSYSDNQHCKWTVYPLTEGVLVQVRFQRLRLWSGDFVRVYSGGVQDCPGNRTRTLLAQLSGMYENDRLPEALPPFRSNTCIVVEFDTDGKHERGYAVNEAYGDGFELSYSRDVAPESVDCNGNDQDSDGLCLCGGTAWGGDCSHTSFCLGTTRVKIDGQKHVLQSSVHSTKEALSTGDDYFVVGQDRHPYPNDLDCTYELDVGTAHNLARVELYYDIEHTFDLLKLRSGIGEDSTYHVLSGRSFRPEIFYIPVDGKTGIANLHLTTDDKGRRRGFYAEIHGESSTSPSCEIGRFGSCGESSYCMQNNMIRKQADPSQSFAGRVTSQDPSIPIRAMPWSPEGGCTWEIDPNEDSTGSIRLIFHKFDLEPHPKGAVGDGIIFDPSGDKGGIKLSMQSCENDGTCNDFWHTGYCIDGRCGIRSQTDLNGIGANVNKTLIRLVTDRNDGGKNFNGVDFDVHYVQSCPADSCISAMGSCTDHLCTCPNSVACDCSCSEEPADDSISPRIIAALVVGVACAVALPLLILFLFYRRKNQNIIKKQSLIIDIKTSELQKKEAELKASQLGPSKFGDSLDFVSSLLKSKSGELDPSEIEKLRLLEHCLIHRDDKTMHIPGNLTKNPGTRYIMKEFGGVSVSSEQVTAPISAPPSSLDNSGHINAEQAGAFDCIPEFVNLDVSQQTQLFELLSLSNLRQWGFNVFDVSAVDEENTLLFVAWAVIGSPHSQFAMANQLKQTKVELNCSDGYSFADLDLKIDMGKLFNYLRVIQRDYKSDTPYHNAIHAADVVQTLHSLIQMADNHFTKEETFSVLVASAVHDVKHPGLNNTFQVNTMSDLAVTHNDAAVLENEHSSHAFKLMVQDPPANGENLNFLCHATNTKFHELRKKIIQAVLHTDMSTHFSTVTQIKSKTAGKSLAEITDPQLRGEILMYMLHVADISNPAKGSPMFKLWTDRCLDEFFAQGDKERDLGLPISPNCDRNETKKPESQIGFINFVVKPAYQVLANVIPAVGDTVLPVIEENLLFWEDQKGRKESV